MIFIDENLNKELGNKTFQEKKQLMKSKTEYILDDIINTADEWNKEKISNRAKYLAKLAYDVIWKL